MCVGGFKVPPRKFHPIQEVRTMLPATYVSITVIAPIRSLTSFQLHIRSSLLPLPTWCVLYLIIRLVDAMCVGRIWDDSSTPLRRRRFEIGPWDKSPVCA